MNFSIIGPVIFIMLILIILKQYVAFWLSLDDLKMKLFKYLLPITEILLLIFLEELFLFPSAITFLILIYNNSLKSQSEYLYYYNINREKFMFEKEYLILTVLLAPLFIILVNIASVEIMDIARTLGVSLNGDEYENIYKSEHIIDYLVGFGVICIVAPIVEEFTFRFIIYESWLSRKFDKKIYAVVLSSLMFTLSHFDINIFVYTFITGIILCFIYDVFGFLSSVILHMVFNVYAFLGLMGIIISKSLIITIAFISLVLIIILNLMKKPNYGIFRSRS